MAAQRVNLNMVPNNSLPQIHLSQGDIGRQFVLNLVDSSTGYEIPAGATVTVRGTKPSGMGYTVTGTVNESAVTVVTTADMTDEFGMVASEVVITSGGTVIGSTNFALAIEMDPHPAGTIDGRQESLIPELTLLVERVEAAAASVHDLSVSATTLAPGSAATATYDDETNQISFGIPRGADGVDGEVTQAQLDAAVTDLKSEINTLSNKSLLAFSAADFTNGYISSTGTEVSSTTNMRTGYINVSDWFEFGINTLVTVSALGIAEYSSENANDFIQRTVVTNNKHNEIVFNENTKFVRFWINYNNSDNPINYFSTIGVSAFYLNRPAYKSDLDTLFNIVFAESEFTNHYISGTGQVVAQLNNMLSAYKNVAGSTDVVINTDTSVKTIAVSQFSEKDGIAFIRRDYVQDTNEYRLVLDENARYIRIAINYDNSHDPISYYNTIGLSAYRNSHIASKVETGILENEIKEISKSIGGKYVHFSFDDCVFWHDLITNENVYTSAFENPMLGALRRIHESSGAKFTLNCFCTDGAVSISDVPNKFQNDFQSAKEWLKFAFHAEDSSTYYDTDKVAEITSSYDTFVDAIYTMTGDYECIDRITRLGFFSGTLNNVIAIRDADCGITGLLTADDTRVSYYFDTSLNDYILAHPKAFDANNQLMLIKSQPRVDGVSDMATYCDRFITKEYGNFYKYLEIFMHEYVWATEKEAILTSMFDIFKHRGYSFEFWDNVFNV